MLPNIEVTTNDEFVLQNTNYDDFTFEEKTKDVVVFDNIGLSFKNFKDIKAKNTQKIIDNNDKNTEKIREEIKVNSKAEKNILKVKQNF